MRILLNTIKELHDEFYFHTFENGAKWLNTMAAEAFQERYPNLVLAINTVIKEARKLPEWYDE